MQYQWLLRLTGNALAFFLQHNMTVDEAWCRKALKNINPEEELEAPPIENDPPPQPGEGEAPVLPNLLPVSLDRSLLEWHRCQVHLDGLLFRIVFSHLSAADEQQKAYCNCLNPMHESCFRWRMCSQFKDRSALAAYMVAWAYEGQELGSREEHMQNVEPSADFIEAVAVGMELSEL